METSSEAVKAHDSDVTAMKKKEEEATLGRFALSQF